MLGWLKKRLRRWLELDEPARVNSLECLIEGQLHRMAVGEPVGVRLTVYDGRGTYLVGASQCIDKHEFWRAWSQRTKPITFEDGTPFEPEKMT